ncbi:MAG: DUF3857 domain-containing protein [bacterium]
MRLRTIVFSVLLATTWLGTGNVQAGELEDEFSSLMTTATTEVRTPLALEAVVAMQRLSPYLAFPAYRDAVTQAALKAKNPIAGFQLAQMATQAALNANDPNAAAKMIDGQGCLTQWSIVGPFANENMESLAAPLGPETGDPGPYAGKVVEVAWRPLPKYDRQCEFWLSQVTEPDSAAVVYLSTQIDSPKAQKTTLLLGTHGAYRVWVNGTLVGENKEDYGMSPDSDGWKVDLKKGPNTVLLKLASTGSGTLGAVARVVDGDLKPAAFAQPAADVIVPPAVSDATKMAADLRAVRAQAAAMANGAAPGDALYAAWLWKEVSPKDVSTPWRNVAARVSADPTKLTPRQHALLAEMYEEEFKQVDIVEAAYQRAPKDPFIATRLAALYDSGITETRQLQARKLLESVIADAPDFLPARLLLSGWFRARGFNETAFALLNAKPDMDRPAWVARSLSLNNELGTREERQALLDQSLRIAFYNGSEVWERVRDLSAEGKHEDALKLVRAWRKLTPLSAGGARYEAQQLRALGRLDEAAAVWSQMASFNPGDSDPLRERAEVYVAMGRAEEAAQDVESALLRRPQDQFLRDYAAFLKPTELRFWDAWMVDDIPAFAKTVAPTPFNYDTLVDQTIVYVAPNGLSQQVHQTVERVLTADGIDDAKFQQIAYQGGDERVDVLRVRVYKADGTVSEDFDQWESGGSRKASTTYNDTTYVNVRANNVSVGDIVEVQWRSPAVANANFRGDYFGDIDYLQGRATGRIGATRCSTPNRGSSSSAFLVSNIPAPKTLFPAAKRCLTDFARPRLSCASRTSRPTPTNPAPRTCTTTCWSATKDLGRDRRAVVEPHQGAADRRRRDARRGQTPDEGQEDRRREGPRDPQLRGPKHALPARRPWDPRLETLPHDHGVSKPLRRLQRQSRVAEGVARSRWR